MKLYLNEDTLPKKLEVKFSNEISNLIEDVDFQNQFEIETITNWHNYIEGLICWISNPVIAWDNTNKYEHDYANNITHINDNGYDVTFMFNTDKTCLIIIKANLKYEEYGLEYSSLYENHSTRKKHILNESQLRRIIRESIKRYLKIL